MTCSARLASARSFGLSRASRPAAGATFTLGVASLSWIDPRLFPRILKVDSHAEADWVTPTTVSRAKIIGREGYRFANFLEVTVTLDARGAIESAKATSASTMYRNSSALGIESEAYDLCTDASVSRREATFFQLVGCRTHSPEVIAQVLGGCVGREIVEQFYVLPPIWTELTLSVRADGAWSGAMTGHSLFPSVSLFTLGPGETALRRAGAHFDAVPKLKEWDDHGWGPYDRATGGGNPWNIPRPIGLGDGRGRVADAGKCPRVLPIGKTSR